MNARKMFAVIGCLGVMISVAGCANREVVKKEEPIGGKEVTTKPVSAPDHTMATIVEKKDESKKPVPDAPKESHQQSAKAATKQAEFEKIYFDFDSADLSKTARDTLDHNAEIMMKSKDVKLSIEGNCDERGSAEYNLALGEKRAKAAVKYLVTLGVQPERLSTVSYGKEHPAVQGHDESAWAKNRRDDFIIQR